MHVTMLHTAISVFDRITLSETEFFMKVYQAAYEIFPKELNQKNVEAGVLRNEIKKIRGCR